MRKLIFVVMMAFFAVSSGNLFAQSPQGKKIGFGVMLGDPSGATLKIWQTDVNAWVIDVGSSYFGSPRVDVDYLWHFNAFHSSTASLYAGPGGTIGFGRGHGFWYEDNGFYYRTSGIGIGVRGVFGVNFIPRNTPLEIFGELGVLVGLAPDFGSAVDAAEGIRFYP